MKMNLLSNRLLIIYEFGLIRKSFILILERLRQGLSELNVEFVEDPN